MSVVLGLLLLSALVFVHELGHFAAARLCRVGVEAFSVGMGPVLLHRNFRGTDWRLSAIPLGGYCAMKGEQDADSPPGTADADSFFGRHAIFRALIGIAGPLTNLLFAAAAMTLVALVPHPYYSETAEIALAESGVTAAADAGLRTGDVILSIAGEEVSGFSDIPRIVSPLAGRTVPVVVERGGGRLSVDVSVADDGGTGRLGVTNVRKMTEARPLHLAVADGLSGAGRLVSLYVGGLASLLRSEVKLTESLSGPARITAELGGAAGRGFAVVMQFLAYISVALFVMNLLPLPVLDGWLVLVSLVEAASGTRIRGRAREIAQYAGIALLAALLILATANDILYFVGLRR